MHWLALEPCTHYDGRLTGLVRDKKESLFIDNPLYYLTVLLYVCIIFSNNKTIFKNGSISREMTKELGPLWHRGLPWKTLKGGRQLWMTWRDCRGPGGEKSNLQNKGYRIKSSMFLKIHRTKNWKHPETVVPLGRGVGDPRISLALSVTGFSFF